MRFVDASVFFHALLKPRRELQAHEIQMKKSAQKIVQRINQGEKVGITAVQISEVANLLESHRSSETARKLEIFLIVSPNIKTYSVTKNNLIEACKVVEDYKNNKIGLSDSLSYVVMNNHHIKEIYSFDKHFDVFNGIERVIE
ncbi:MAG: PIN domain-containing protein [Methanobacteriaceae archaeon]|nr:PIN domain-containing protein [Methanobacteriaceae archaeon]